MLRLCFMYMKMFVILNPTPIQFLCAIKSLSSKTNQILGVKNCGIDWCTDKHYRAYCSHTLNRRQWHNLNAIQDLNNIYKDLPKLDTFSEVYEWNLIKCTNIIRLLTIILSLCVSDIPVVKWELVSTINLDILKFRKCMVPNGQWSVS